MESPRKVRPRIGRPPSAERRSFALPTTPALKRQLIAESEAVIMPLGRYAARILEALSAEQRTRLAMDGRE